MSSQIENGHVPICTMYWSMQCVSMDKIHICTWGSVEPKCLTSQLSTLLLLYLCLWVCARWRIRSSVFASHQTAKQTKIYIWIGNKYTARCDFNMIFVYYLQMCARAPADTHTSYTPHTKIMTGLSLYHIVSDRMKTTIRSQLPNQTAAHMIWSISCLYHI